MPYDNSNSYDNTHPYANTRRRRKKRSWFQRNAHALIFLFVFALLFFFLGWMVGRSHSSESGETSSTASTQSSEQMQSRPSSTQNVPSSTQGMTSTTQSTTETEPQITTEAPTTEPAAIDPQDLIDDSTTRTVYLTFDDGPGKYTFEILDILDRYNVKATFFNVGYYIDRNPENTKAIMERGHLVACHSYTHEWDQCYASVNAFMDEIDQWKAAVMNACGRLPDRICVRFPGGSTTGYAKDVAAGIKEKLLQNGYRWFDWNAGNNDKYPKGNVKGLDEPDYFKASYNECMDWYKNKDNATVILLTHETEKNTVATLAYMLQDLLDRGYTFKTLDHHPDWNDN